ncbi:hypothetical protein FHK92_19655 [Pseudomonas brassicacearum subsp. neoaurantiaca]|uniref:Uncharacterized protein n=1 Tax=Pseudomonas brassicacearum subsp. neoaurantiaca TaxID=494916 RepID=A0A7V8UEB4_9PSED|nr:hypothetical protein [Pseudomonas brassicacearum subsp. neoaurantiaca]
MKPSWRGSLLPLGCEAAPKPEHAVYQADRVGCLGTASRSSGSKLPRHKRQPAPSPITDPTTKALP